MKRLIIAVCAVIALAGCSSSTADSMSVSTPTSHAPSTVAASPSGSPTNPIAAAIAAGDYPPCTETVGLPTSVVLDEANSSDKGLIVHCYTGSSVAADHTGGSVTPCDPLDDNSTPVYYWASQDASTADQNVYAAKRGGVVVVVPNQTAHEFFTIGGGLASVLLATGSC